MLHLKDGIFAEVDERFQLLFVTTLSHDRVEEGAFGFLTNDNTISTSRRALVHSNNPFIYLDLRLLPLLYIRLRNLKVDSLNRFATSHNLDAAQEVLKVVQNTTSRLQEAGQPMREDAVV